ncbi:cilia- and flagella-associated protein 20-like [Pieris rapae]|uniref:cilia- and flagella-associated protein 20-like n=1 Tax=Pieris rapae TaxID=64459 RepID=UPI001E27C1DC|nr:cilia- and flagella-associated protein 20-like [Pieris rapae]
MFKNTYQNGLLSIFYSCGSNPLAIWDMEVQNGHIKRLTDTEVNSIVLEIVSTNVATTYITCPKRNQVLGIKLPFLVMIVKNLKRYFSFEITILDDKNLRRRFRISNFQSTTKIKPFCTSMPIGLSGGWNQIQFNLADFTRRAYGTQFIETLRVQIHANTRLRRIYFSERLYSEDELPQDYKLYLPLERKQKKGKVGKKDEAPPPPPPPDKAAPIPPLVEEIKPPVASDAPKEEAPETPAPVTPATPEPEEVKQEPVESPAPEEQPVETAAEPDAAPEAAEEAPAETEEAPEAPPEAPVEEPAAAEE